MQDIKKQELGVISGGMLRRVWTIGFIIKHLWQVDGVFKVVFRHLQVQICHLLSRAINRVIPGLPPSCLHQLESPFCISACENCLPQPGVCSQLYDLHVASWNNWQRCSSLWACIEAQKTELNHLCTSRVLWGSFAILRSWDHLGIFDVLVLLKMFLYKENHASH